MLPERGPAPDCPSGCRSVPGPRGPSVPAEGARRHGVPGAVGLWPVKSLAPARAPTRGHRRVHPHPGRPLPGRRPSGGRGGGATYLGHITAQPDHKSVNKVWARSPTGLENRYPGLARDETRVTTPGQPRQRGGATLVGGTPPPRAAQARHILLQGWGVGVGRGGRRRLRCLGTVASPSTRGTRLHDAGQPGAASQGLHPTCRHCGLGRKRSER